MKTESVPNRICDSKSVNAFALFLVYLLTDIFIEIHVRREY
jgi:hypothetical protein